MDRDAKTVKPSIVTPFDNFDSLRKISILSLLPKYYQMSHKKTISSTV